jgi:hypothetical protein
MEGFYKLNEDNELMCAPNFVCTPDYELYKEQHETYTYPVDGWSWFNSEQEAADFFGITLTTESNGA